MPTIKLLKKKRDSVQTTRKGEYQSIYQDRRWKRIVAHKRRINPLCERCEKKGKITPVFEVHHTIPFETGRTPDEVELLAFDINNTESICDPCHSEAHKELKNK